MRNLFFLFSLLIFGAIEPAYSSIEEIHSFKQMENAILNKGRITPSETLLVFDIDNTLITPATDEGSDPWFYCLYDAFGKKPMEDPQWDSKILTLWNQTQNKIKVLPAEPIIPKWIKERQSEGFKTMALTARSYQILKVTLKQLHVAGIEMEKNSPYSNDMILSSKDLQVEKKGLFEKEPAHYTQGVLAVGESNSKGAVFTQFLKKISFAPKRVFFVDDKQKNVLTMDNEMAKTHLPFLAFRYGALDQRVTQFKCDHKKVRSTVNLPN